MFRHRKGSAMTRPLARKQTEKAGDRLENSHTRDIGRRDMDMGDAPDIVRTIKNETSPPEEQNVPEEGRSEKRRRPTLPHCGAVPSARPGLTSLFGMGRGGAPEL